MCLLQHPDATGSDTAMNVFPIPECLIDRLITLSCSLEMKNARYLRPCSGAPLEGRGERGEPGKIAYKHTFKQFNTNFSETPTQHSTEHFQIYKIFCKHILWNYEYLKKIPRHSCPAYNTAVLYLRWMGIAYSELVWRSSSGLSRCYCAVVCRLSS
jgi:hypothetical protein